MTDQDEENMAEMRRLALDSALNGNDKQAQNVINLGKAMEKQVKNEKRESK